MTYPTNFRPQDVSAALSDSTGARITLGAGTEARPPLLFMSGPLTTVPQQGAMEYQGNTAYFTSFLVRRSIALGQEVITSPVTIANTAAETVIYQIPMAANFLKVGKQIEIVLNGIFSSVIGGNGVATFRIKYAGVTVATILSVAGANSNSPFNIDTFTTCRAIGAGTAGKLITYTRYEEGIADKQVVAGTPVNIDTTTDNTLTITVQFATANASNTLTVNHGRTLCIDDNL